MQYATKLERKKVFQNKYSKGKLFYYASELSSQILYMQLEAPLISEALRSITRVNNSLPKILIKGSHFQFCNFKPHLAASKGSATADVQAEEEKLTD